MSISNRCIVILVASMATLCAPVASSNERVVTHVFLSNADWSDEGSEVDSSDPVVNDLNSHIASVRNNLDPLLPPAQGMPPEDADYGVDRIEVLNVGEDRYDLSCVYERLGESDTCHYKVPKSEASPGGLLAQKLIEGTIYHPFNGAYGPPVEVTGFLELAGGTAVIATVAPEAESRVKNNAQYVIMTVYSFGNTTYDCYTQIDLTLRTDSADESSVLLSTADQLAHKQLVQTLSDNLDKKQKMYLAMAYPVRPDEQPNRAEREGLEYDLTSSGSNAAQTCSR